MHMPLTPAVCCAVRFIVDGNWHTSSLHAIEQANGVNNNYINVEARPLKLDL